MIFYTERRSDISNKPYDFFSDLLAINIYCVVPENIQTPTTEGIGNSEGVGGSMAQEIPKGRGVSRPNSLPDGLEND